MYFKNILDKSLAKDGVEILAHEVPVSTANTLVNKQVNVYSSLTGAATHYKIKNFFLEQYD